MKGQYIGNTVLIGKSNASNQPPDSGRCGRFCSTKSANEAGGCVLPSTSGMMQQQKTMSA